MQFLKNILKIIISILVFGLVPIILFILITSRTSVLFGIKSYVVQTGSMEPNIHVGSMVFTIPKSTYVTGNIITFNRGSITVTHRIAGILNGQFQTKGDANKVADPQLVSRSSVIGKDFLIIPYFGKFTNFIKTIPGFAIFIGIPVLIFIGFELMNIKKEIEKQTEIRVRKQLEQQGSV